MKIPFALLALSAVAFQEGIRSLVYAQGDEDALQTTSCSRTTPVGVRPGGDLEVLRAGN